MSWKHIAAGACLACVVAAGTPARATYTALYAFGDSLSDAGNVYLATSGAQPAPPYVAGHFSNGPTAVEDLSAGLGLGILLPSLAGGGDYAFGGAQTGATVPGPAPLVPTLSQQVAQFSAKVGGAAPGTALYSVWIGNNDLLNIIGYGLVPATISFSQAQTYAQSAAAAEAAAIGTLASEGAKSFLVPLLPDLGKTPRFSAAGAVLAGAATGLAQTYNAALVGDLATLGATPGESVTVVDTFSFLDAAIANPAPVGLTDVTDPCYAGPYTGGGSACAAPGQYLFWDSVHPTAAGHARIAALAAADLPLSVPEPSTAALLLSGVIGLWAGRRRS